MVLCERTVRSSAGTTELRPVVRTEIQLGDLRLPIDLTLTNRDTMGFRRLLGRSAIRGRFVVDPSRSFVQRRPGADVPCRPTAVPVTDPAAPPAAERIQA